MKTDLDKTKSIQELENDYWPDYEYPTGLVHKCHEYRKIPLGTLTIEQIRVLISQNIGLVYLMPIALQTLKKNILTEVSLYEGDLLAAILRVENQYWTIYPQIKNQVVVLLDAQRKNIEKKNIENTHRQILKIIDQFGNE